MDSEPLGIVFGRPWLRGDSDPLKGFELGRLGLACLSTEKIILHTHSFYEIPYLIKEIGKRQFFKEIKEDKLTFICQIENIGIFNSTESSVKATGTMIFPVELTELREKRDIQIFENLLKDDEITLSETELSLLFNSITFTTKSLNQEIMRELTQDIVDLKIRLVITDFFQAWFNTDENVLDYLRIDGETSIIFEAVQIASKNFSDSKLQTLFFMLYTAYSQAAICNFLKVSQAFSDMAIFDLQLKIMQAKSEVHIDKFEEIIDTTTNSIELPNISWLVSREILPISEMFSFKNSSQGKEFRNFLRSFKNEDIEVIQGVQKSLIKSLHGKTKWETAWESGVSKVIRLSVSTGLGLIPGVGTFLGLGATAVDTAIDKTLPRNFKPTVVLDNMISKNTDVEKIAKEKLTGTKFPSLDELEKRGFKPSFYLVNSKETRAWIFLDKPNSEEHWELGLDFSVDESLRSYFDEFRRKLSNYSSDVQKFIEMLKNGETIKQQTTNFSNNPDTGESSLTLSYEIESKLGIQIFSSGERKFWDFIHGRKYFEHPRSYNEKIEKILLELKKEN